MFKYQEQRAIPVSRLQGDALESGFEPDGAIERIDEWLGFMRVPYDPHGRALLSDDELGTLSWYLTRTVTRQDSAAVELYHRALAIRVADVMDRWGDDIPGIIGHWQLPDVWDQSSASPLSALCQALDDAIPSHVVETTADGVRVNGVRVPYPGAVKAALTDLYDRQCQPGARSPF